jgi:hypothetical protein
MAMTYREFLDKSWGAGAASNATRAAAWRRLYGPEAQAATAPQQQAAPAAAPAAPRPTFTPGALDESGARAKADLDFGFQTGSAAAQREYDDQVAQLDAQRPQLEKSRDQGYIGADNRAAANGMVRGGQRILNRTKIGTEFDQGIQNLNLQRTAAANRRQATIDTLTGNYRQGTTNNTIDSNVRQKQAWDENNPITVTPTPEPAAKPKPRIDYKSWLGGRTSTPTTAAAWRKAMGL